MKFQQLTLNQVEIVREKFATLSSKTCDYTVGGMFMWRDFYKMEYHVDKDDIFIRQIDNFGNIFYALPMSNDIVGALQKLACEELAAGNNKLRFCTIPEEYLETITQLFGEFRIFEDMDFFDYLYRTLDIVELKGHKYSGQRNLINQFKRNINNWSFCPIDSENIRRVIEYYHNKCTDLTETSVFAQEENRMVRDVLVNMNIYGMLGGFLEANGEIVGFSLGEIINQTLYTHVERADRHVKGAYQMLVNQFANTFAKDKVDFINREEDMGNIGLRIAKEAYHPVCLLKKYTIEGVLL